MINSIKQFHDDIISLKPIDLMTYKNYIPEFMAFANCQQSKEHHAEGNVLIHANLAAQQILPLLNQIETQEDKIVLYIATILHDAGKSVTSVFNSKKNKITAYGHDKAGVPIAREFLFKYFPEFKYPMRSKILSLIEWHMHPRQMMSDGTSDTKLKTLSLAVNTKMLCILSIADTLGRVAEDMSGVELLEKFKAECERLDIWGKPYVIPNSRIMSNHGYSNARWNILVNGFPETKETMERAEDLIMEAIPRFQLLLLVGAPGSGKSTYREQLLKECPNAVVLSMDDKRKELTGDANDQSRNNEVFAWQQRQLSRAMEDKKNVIIDATNPSRKLRKVLWQIGRRNGAVPGVVYFDLPLATLKERNKNREKRVPDDVVDRIYNNLEYITPLEADGLKIIE